MTHHEILGTPGFDRLLVEVPVVADTTKGGLYIPETSKAKVERGIGRGHVLDAGLKALDVMKDAGWRFGDEVTWGLYAPVYIEWEDDSREKHRALVINVADVLTNVSHAKRLNSGAQVIEFIDGQHRVRDLTNTEAAAKKRRNGDANAHAA